MNNLVISNNLKKFCDSIALGFVQCEVTVTGKNKDLWQEISVTENFLLKNIEKAEIKNLPPVKASREFYKKAGRNPDRYPLSSEALLKRILSGKGLYQINNIVDINNLISMRSYFSVGSYDLEKIVDEITFDLGESGEEYESLGKGIFDIGNLPVFRDGNGAFGSPTSDSKRTCITGGTSRIINVIISFSGKEDLAEAIKTASELFIKYADAKQLREGIIV